MYTTENKLGFSLLFPPLFFSFSFFLSFFFFFFLLACRFLKKLKNCDGFLFIYFLIFLMVYGFNVDDLIYSSVCI